MSILVVGSLALDTIETPFGRVEGVLGGSAIYFSLSASFFTDVSLVGVVGADFPDHHIAFLEEQGIDLGGLHHEDGKTFRWEGRYGYNLNDAETLDTQLNVFQTFSPEIPPQYRNAEYVFLANIDPELQLRVLSQVDRPRVIACDTMNFWIENKLEALKRTLRKIDILIINEAEARELSQEFNLIRASRAILTMGPKTLVIKQGTYGALMFNGASTFFAPAYPLEQTFDPTGAGDTFAGGFMGYLARCGSAEECSLRRAVICGSVMASFCVEKFSVERLRTLSFCDVEQRFREFRTLTIFDDISL
ncbi:MAG TPA: PfkB family carbohydrate kinase [Thermodesulfobacteriota bacterium]|nr:sugar kinase [Deltaproteobacteria bacterium]HNR13228.1 PfkB family carbohydrate kinase [Thermodesulfobacteriota bacterium]HNU70873.1 PfkB family carbohydrate kinase [Thermodesulfobacteriota bacterium]HOC37866.1 PfkB family carbohydrate kinase [Thermodesulfobacteriota bacterium]